jgi:hypothetical protein
MKLGLLAIGLETGMPANTPFDPNDVIRGNLGLEDEEIEIEDPAIAAAIRKAEEKAEREIEEIRARAKKEKEMIKRGESPAPFESDMDPVAFAPDGAMNKLMEESLLKIERQNQTLKDSLSTSARIQQDFQNQLNMNHSLQSLENKWNIIEEALEKKINKKLI